MKVSIEISAERISDVLVSAFEGGSNYWYDDLAFARLPSESEMYDEFIKRRLESGNGAVFSLVDKENKNKKYHISVRKIKEGVQKMAQNATAHFADILHETDDAITGDVLLQYIVIGDLVYG